MAIIALLLLTGCAGKAVSITNDRTTPAIWRISNGTVQVTVDTAKSRISSYGYVGGRNVLWVNPDPGNEPINSTPGPNWGGDKVWIWPQSDWNWPPPLPENGYTASVSRDGKTLVMKSSPDCPLCRLRGPRDRTLATGHESHASRRVWSRSRPGRSCLPTRLAPGR